MKTVILFYILGAFTATAQPFDAPSADACEERKWQFEEVLRAEHPLSPIRLACVTEINS